MDEPNKPILKRLAVCGWSLQPESPAQLLAQLETIGVKRLQCALDPLREAPDAWGSLGEQCVSADVTVVSGMFTTVGEDYGTLESIRRTGGLVPDETWPQNWENIQANADLAALMGLRLISFHAGFLPHQQDDPNYPKLLDRIAKVVDLFAARNIHLCFETGQETAATLAQFLTELNRSHAGVNFDPANMILYDKGNPIDALRGLAPWLKQCHIKDAIRTKTPGTWGEEVAVGTGEVDWPGFFQTLDEIGFRGDCAIEREAGNQRVEDIRTARDFIAGCTAKTN